MNHTQLSLKTGIPKDIIRVLVHKANYQVNVRYSDFFEKEVLHLIHHNPNIQFDISYEDGLIKAILLGVSFKMYYTKNYYQVRKVIDSAIN